MRSLFDQISLLIQRFKIINSLLSIICFVVIPIFFLNRGIDSYLHSKQSSLVEKKQIALEQTLDTLELFTNNDYFAHFLLTQACQRADASEKIGKSLQHEIERLKSMFPEAFTFIAIDPKGMLMDRISDQTTFKYLYRQAFKLFADIKAAFSQNLPIESVDKIDARLARLSSLLGLLISKDDLMLPLQHGTGGKSIIASGGASKYHLWFFPGKNFTLICFISRSFITGAAGLRWAANQINKKNASLIAGFAKYPLCAENIFPSLSQSMQTFVLMSLGRNESINDEQFPVKSSGRIACRYLSSDWRGFCCFKIDSETNIAQRKYSIIGFICKILFVLFFVSHVFMLHKKVTTSVRLKLTILFAFSLLMPVAIILRLTLEHVAQKEKEVVAQMQAKGFRLLESIDEKYPWFIKRHAETLSAFLTQWLEVPENQSLQPEQLRSFWASAVREFYVQEMMLVDRNGHNHLEGISARMSPNPGIIQRSGAETIQIYSENRLLDKSFKPNIISLIFAEGFLQQSNRIVKMGVGGFEVSILLSYLENVWKGQKRDLIAILGWPYGKLQQCFLQRNFSGPETFPGGYKLFARTINGDRVVIGDKIRNDRVTSLLNGVRSQQINRGDHILFNGTDHIGVAIKGKNLDTMTLAVLISRNPVELEIKKIRASALFSAVIALIIAIWTMHLISRLIFVPLDELRFGIEALGTKDFRHRLQIEGKNELARLGNSFNHALETLQELEVARIVQEAFLPEKHFEKNSLQLLTKNTALSGLEGDYFDYFVVDDQQVCIFIGDATGHGIPAALSMAMAKAVIINAKQDWESPRALMERLNDVFWQIRRQGGKDYMTAQVLLFNSLSGEVEIINAGHCFPVLLRKKSNTVELLQVRGLACGFVRNFRNDSQKLKLESGDILVLYTDGFIEAMNSEGAVLGFDGFLDMLNASRDDDCETFMNRITDLHRFWEKSQQDDQTMVMIRYQANENC